jgi:hypothetical protein
MKKALKIDVVNQTVTNITIDDIDDIYREIGNGCETFCCPINFDNGDTLYADDESLLRENVEGCFMMDSWSYAIVGNAIILGTDFEDGESIDCKYSPMDIYKEIIWGDKNVAEEYRKVALSRKPEFIFC